MRFFLPHVLYTVWCLFKSYAHNNNCKKNLLKKERKSKEKKEKEKKNTTTQIETNVRAPGFNAGLLAGGRFASERSCDRPTRSRSSVVFLGPRADAG
jgi:hypothetical protein